MNTKMRYLVGKVAPYISIIAFAMLFIVLATHPALASTKNDNASDGSVNFSFATAAINSIVAFATGPIARIIAILSIISGAVAFAQGRELNEGLKTLGVIAIAIGLLIGATSMFGGSLSSGVII